MGDTTSVGRSVFLGATVKNVLYPGEAGKKEPQKITFYYRYTVLKIGLG